MKIENPKVTLADINRTSSPMRKQFSLHSSSVSRHLRYGMWIRIFIVKM